MRPLSLEYGPVRNIDIVRVRVRQRPVRGFPPFEKKRRCRRGMVTRVRALGLGIVFFVSSLLTCRIRRIVVGYRMGRPARFPYRHEKC